MVYLNDHIENLDIESALAEVSAQRRAQALCFRHDAGRQQCLAAYLLLKKGLREEFGIDEHPILDYHPNGKPFIVGHPDIHFNLSHSKNVALCVLDSRPVGADVEVLRKVSPGLISYTMNNAEQEWIYASQDATRAFLELWTRKEALLKLLGEGIRHDLKDVLAQADRYLIETVKTENYVYSVARICGSV